MSDKNVVFQEDLLHRKRITWLVSILLDRNVDRDKYIKNLKSNGVDARPFFCALSSMNIYKKYCHVETPVTNDISRQGVNFPTYENLQSAEKIKNILNSIL